jgi:2-keto-4-pentenoate hydratase/2-oxohepta-3-ene-1,7-dioic acid hydratase in catechol pathway
MKLLRAVGLDGKVRTGIKIDEIMYDTSSFGEDYGEAFFETDGTTRLRHFIAENIKTLPVISPDCNLCAPICRPSKIVCIGLNYADHARETGLPIPSEPVIFLKSSSAYSGPFDDIVLPRNSLKSDWEAELAVVIGRRASYVSEADALYFVAGYTVHNDVSEREYQLERGGTWDKGKGCDTFAPFGPCLVTPDEAGDVHQLNIWLTVNGQTRQNSNTSQLIFSVPYLIAYVSQFMTLLPGDIISTGTPAGVGMGLSPAVFLKAGDMVETGIENIGTIRQRVKNY